MYVCTCQYALGYKFVITTPLIDAYMYFFCRTLSRSSLVTSSAGGSSAVSDGQITCPREEKQVCNTCTFVCTVQEMLIAIVSYTWFLPGSTCPN